MKLINDQWCQYKENTTNTILWSVDTIENFYNKYILHINDYMNYLEVSKRKWGEPKLKKPKELKGIKRTFSIKKEGKKNQIFIKENDVWIKDNDYFSDSISQEEAKKLGIKIEIKNKLIYNDNFSAITLRNEAWLCVKNLLLYIDRTNVETILFSKICSFYNWNIDEIPREIERFYSDLIYMLRNNIKNGSD